MHPIKLHSPDVTPTYASCRLPTQWGEFEMRVLNESGPETVVLTMGSIQDGEDILARVHSECLTGDVFSSLRCDCEAQLHAAMEKIAIEGRGVLIYLRQEGRGIGLYNKILAYGLQEEGADTVDANRRLGLPDDLRTYETAAMLFNMLQVKSIRLMTNNPNKIEALEALGIKINQRVGLHVGANPNNIAYIKTKQHRFKHWVD